jgi:DNA-binding NtrC family response regulator
MNESKVALIVEDDADVSFFYRRVLENRGYLVEEYRDVTSAEEVIEGGFKFDLALIDATCPDRSRRKEISFGEFFGLDLARKLESERGDKASIYCVSGYDLGMIASSMGVRFIQKPVTLRDLEKMIE